MNLLPKQSNTRETRYQRNFTIHVHKAVGSAYLTLQGEHLLMVNVALLENWVLEAV